MYSVPKTPLDKAHQYLLLVADHLLYTQGSDEGDLAAVEFTRRDTVVALGHAEVKHVHENGAAAAKLAVMRQFGFLTSSASAPKQLRDPLRLTELATRIIQRAPNALAEALRAPPLFATVLKEAEQSVPTLADGQAQSLPLQSVMPALQKLAAQGLLLEQQLIEAAETLISSWSYAYTQGRKRIIDSLRGHDDLAFRYALGGGGTVHIRFNAPLRNVRQLERFEAAMQLLTESLRDDLE